MASTSDWLQRGLYLQNYLMEAVGFTEFIYEEATQQGINSLKLLKKKRKYNELKDLARKFENNVYMKGLIFHLSYGMLNPYTYPGFEIFYQDAWKKYQMIVTLE